MEPGESISEAALREIKEETGLTDIRLGPVVWYGEDSQRSGNWGITFKEHFIVAHSMSEDIQNDGWTEHERGQILEMRWWDIQDIGDCSDVIYPLDFRRLLVPIIAGEYPAKLMQIPAS